MQAHQANQATAHATQLRGALKIVRRREVEAATGLSRTSLYRLGAAGKFPRPIKLGPHAVGWRADEIAAWIEQRTVERDNKVAA